MQGHKLAMRKASIFEDALGVRRNPRRYGFRVLAADYPEAARQNLGQAELERREEMSGSSYWEVSDVPAGWGEEELEQALADGNWEVVALPGGRRDRGPTALWKIRASAGPDFPQSRRAPIPPSAREGHHLPVPIGEGLL